jgi:hypothetical protein
MSYRYGTIFREIIDSKPVEFCGLIAGKESNLLAKLFIEAIKDSVPQLMHPCPFEVSFGNLKCYN